MKRCWKISNTKINDDHLEDSDIRSSENVKIDKAKVDTINPEVASRARDQDNKSVKEDIESRITDKS